MTEKKSNLFNQFFNKDISKHVYKKPANKAKTVWLKYLQWAWAWYYAKNADPQVELRFKQFPEYDFQTHRLTGRHVDFMDMANGAYVTAILTIKGETRDQTLPVMDWKNNAVVHPDVCQVNKAKQRAFVKCLALFGLGLKLYGIDEVNNKDNSSSSNSSSQRQYPASKNQIGYLRNKLLPEVDVTDLKDGELRAYKWLVQNNPQTFQKASGAIKFVQSLPMINNEK